MQKFSIAIVERPDIGTAGLKVRTNMAKAHEDCSALWRDAFGPRMDAFPADPAYPGQSFGVSVMLDQENFDYWAVMPLAPGAAVPAGMATFDLPAGAYAECRVASLDELVGAYTYVYGEWASAPGSRPLDFSRPCYELYRPEFLTTGAFSVYCPVMVQRA